MPSYHKASKRELHQEIMIAERQGLIKLYSPPSPGRPRHRIVAADGTAYEVRTVSELAALMWGMKAALQAVVAAGEVED